METDNAGVSPEPETKIIIVISTVVLVLSLGFLAWENWKIFLAMLGILFHIIMYVQKELEGVIKICGRISERSPISSDQFLDSND